MVLRVAISLLAGTAVLILMAACGSHPTEPPPTPHLQATIEAIVQQRLAEAQPPTPIPMPTTAPGISGSASQAEALKKCDGQDIYVKLRPSLVEVIAANPEGLVTGTGFIVDGRHGYIITATHVVSKARSITVEFSNGVSQPAKWVAQVERADISLLGTIGTSFPSLRITEGIYNMGAYTAEGTELVALGVIDGGYVTSPGQVLSVITDNAGRRNIKVNAPTEPGMSGGPLVDGCGYLFGVVSLGNDGISTTTVAAELNQSDADNLIAYAEEGRRLAPILISTPTPTPSPRQPHLPTPTPTLNRVPTLILAPTHTPPTPTPIPFSCTKPLGADVSELSYTLDSDGYIDVAARITNTCNQKITVFATAVVYGRGDRIIGSNEILGTPYRHAYGLKPGESRVVTAPVGCCFKDATRVSIEPRYERY